ncbi:UDP-N-acetylmuramoyl-L-alanine--D-glutamate ligase [Coraliomargarita parva]|uniref:UDP-N-acetylmuramoyl-L-alanine--D-glutamate ligase n=1 Tax=Coraliomargarita parva TaxID=3014050 RepID=UPI0022B4D4B1|nr:UDP-N-acetylmuramoyl-L-alanine--D-glutamate ligase [Coraliomargarita parva]
MAERIAVFGAGVSGCAAAALAKEQGADVRIYDEQGRGDAARVDASELSGFDLLVFSPGFSGRHPWRILAEASGKPIYGELGYAARYWKGQQIGVTGTNGKTTLTRLLASAFENCGHTTVAVGNIGVPLSEVVLSDLNQPESIAVCEISSFQAEMPEGLSLDGLLWTNFAEDHLDRYATMEEYFNAKSRLFGTLKEDAICVVGEAVANWIELYCRHFNACAIAYGDPVLYEQLDADSPFRRHPYSENFALAAEFWWLIGQKTECLIKTANAFVLSEHRLSVVAEWGGVRFWNDSKATNFHATLAAIHARRGHRIVWVGGGQSKGGDLQYFAKSVAGQVDQIFLYGEVAGAMAAALGAQSTPVEVHPLCEDAIRAACAAALANPPAEVVFSPGFASFDQFSSYSERGKCFVSIVLGLKQSSQTQ